MGFELPPKQLWLPARAAIIRPATKELLPAPVMGLTMLARMAMLRTAKHQAAFAVTSVAAGTTITAGVGLIHQSANIPAGSTVVALGVTNSATKIVTAIDDDNGTYTQIGSTLTLANLSLSLWYTFNSPGMSGSDFFGTFSSAPTAWGFSALAISGALASDPLDATATNTNAFGGTSIAATVSSIAAKTLMVGALASDANGTSILTQTGYATPFTPSGGAVFGGGGNKQLSSAGSNTYTGVLNNSGQMALIVATFALL